MGGEENWWWMVITLHDTRMDGCDCDLWVHLRIIGVFFCDRIAKVLLRRWIGEYSVRETGNEEEDRCLGFCQYSMLNLFVILFSF